MSQTWVVLLRAINVGSRNRVPMATLREVYTEAGCDEVRTYIASGNAVIRTAETDGRVLADRLQQAVKAATGVDAPHILRTREEWEAVTSAEPWPGESRDHTHVAFFDAPPPPAAVAEAEARDIAPDRMAVIGAEVWWHLPNGVMEAKFAGPAADKALGKGTMRTWRTVEKITALLDKMEA